MADTSLLMSRTINSSQSLRLHKNVQYNTGLDKNRELENVSGKPCKLKCSKYLFFLTICFVYITSGDMETVEYSGSIIELDGYFEDVVHCGSSSI